MALTLTELYVIRDLLVMSAEEFGDHGCNDYHLLPTHDSERLINEMQAVDEDPMPKRIHLKGDYIVDDFVLMYYLATRVKQEIDLRETGG